jgi:hypothetical protein
LSALSFWKIALPLNATLLLIGRKSRGVGSLIFVEIVGFLCKLYVKKWLVVIWRFCRGFCEKRGAERGVLVVKLWWFVW